MKVGYTLRNLIYSINLKKENLTLILRVKNKKTIMVISSSWFPFIDQSELERREKNGNTSSRKVRGDERRKEWEKERHNQKASKNQDALRSTYSAYREAFSYTGEFGVKARTLASAGALPPPLSCPLWPRLHPRYLFLRQPPQPYLRSQGRALTRRLEHDFKWFFNYFIDLKLIFFQTKIWILLIEFD